MKDNWEPGITSAEVTDIGMRRVNNQDSCLTILASSEERFNSHGHLFVVADGMGAHAAGELASQLATENICNNYFRSATASYKSLEDAFLDANREIYKKGQSNPEFHNMGTTASGLVLSPEGALIGHVGDSRVYRLRNECLEQLTFDHSLVWEIEANPEIQRDAWSGPIPKNVITRSLGPNPNVQIDIEGPFKVEPNDRFILCSDGLSGVVDDEEIGTLVSCLDAPDAAQVLVDLANLRGGPDNITATVVNVKAEANGTDPNRAQTSPAGSTKAPAWVINVNNSMLAIAVICAFLTFGVGRSPFLLLSLICAMTIACLSLKFRVLPFIQKGKNKKQLTIPKGKAPYRSYDARPSKELYDRLGQTVVALREASEEHNWLMEWGTINRHQKNGERCISENNAQLAIQAQSYAIIEAMKQLREQQNRAANDTSIEL